MVYLAVCATILTYLPRCRLFHKATADNETFSIIETRILWARITQLKPNSQHVVYVVAYNDKGQSLPSETLVAWTDPALPAFVDVGHL